MKGCFKGNYEKVKECIQKVKDAEHKSLKERMMLQRDVMRDLDTDDEYEMFEKNVTLLCVRCCDMGLNTDPWSPNWATKVAEFKAMVEREGMAAASWSCTGRTRHQMHATQLAEALPEFDFDIGYNYHCVAYKK